MTDKSKDTFIEHMHRVPFYGIIVTVLISVLLVSIIILYEARTAVLQRYMTPSSVSRIAPMQGRLVLSADSIDRVREFASDHSELAVVGVVSVDFSQNSRETVVRFFNDPAIEKQVTAQLHANAESPLPLLIPNDKINNDQIADLLNGEFTCSNAIDGIFVQLYNLDAQLRTVCRVPVPPYYGRLTGYLVMYSKKEMSIYEKDQLRAAAIRLAVDMYYQDVARPYMGTIPQ